MTFDETKYREASELVKSIELDWTRFNLFGIDYALRTCPSQNPNGSQNGQAAEYAPQEERGEWAIYLWEDIEEHIQRPLLFHEVVEVYHRKLGMKKTPAHNSTMSWERRFCEDNLTNSNLEDYLRFKKEHGYNGFDLSDKQ